MMVTVNYDHLWPHYLILLNVAVNVVNCPLAFLLLHLKGSMLLKLYLILSSIVIISTKYRLKLLIRVSSVDATKILLDLIE